MHKQNARLKAKVGPTKLQIASTLMYIMHWETTGTKKGLWHMNKNSVFYIKIKTVNTSCSGKTMNLKKYHNEKK
jgi:hypothetical protein